MTDRPNSDQTATKQPFTIGDAADRLGMSSEAVRMRLKRGTLAGAKVDGRWVVYLDITTERDQTTDPTPPKHSTEHDQTALVESLREQVTYLRDQLDRALRSSEAERERSDVIQQLALNRIALTTGDEPEHVTDPLSASPDDPGREQAVAMSQDTLHESSIVASWIRRLFGRS